MCFTGKKISANPARTDIWQMVAGGNRCCQKPHGSYQYQCDHFQANVSKLRGPLDTVDLEELPDSRERAGAPVLWLSCEGQINVWELFPDKSSLSAIIDQQGLLVAAPIDLRTKKAEISFHSCCMAFGSKLKNKSPKIVVMVPTVTTKSFKQSSFRTLRWPP